MSAGGSDGEGIAFFSSFSGLKYWTVNRDEIPMFDNLRLRADRRGEGSFSSTDRLEISLVANSVSRTSINCDGVNEMTSRNCKFIIRCEGYRP